MRHLTLLSLFLLLCLGLVAVPGALPETAVPPAAAAFGLEDLQVQKITLQPLPQGPLIADAAADSCSNATEILLSGSGVGETTVVNSMSEGAEDPVLSCAFGSPSRPQGYRTVWYKFTPEANGRVTIDTTNNFNPNSYDTILAVYTGSCGLATLNMVACNDDYRGFASRVTLDVYEGDTYFVEVADWNAAQPGPLELDIFFVLDPIETRWELQNSSAPARTRHATVKANGLIYQVGGQTNATGTPTLSSGLYRYNVGDGTWATLPPMPGDPLTDVTAASLNGRIFVPGGYNGNNMVGTHHVYNIAAGLWEDDRQPPPVAVGWAEAVVPADQGGYYLVGGISNTAFLSDSANVHDDVSFFNISNSQWSTTPPDMNVPRYGHTAVWLNNGIYVVGGIDDNNQLLPGGEFYQPAGSGTWQTLPPMNIARYGASSAVSPGGKWYVFGGLDFNNKAVPEVEVFDPLNPGAGWRLLGITYDLGGSTNIRARAFPAGEFVGNYLYAIGGHDTRDFLVTPLVQRLLVLDRELHLPVIMRGGTNPFNDNFTVAVPLAPNVAQIHKFDDSFDFFDAFTFVQSSPGIVTVRLSQIPSGSDYNVTVYDANKSVRGSGILAGNQSEAVTLFLSTGRYYIMVERIFGQADGSNYRLIVEK
ncbi:MAG: hypothetical protein IPM53_33505 [Anaerolineaceae bacterium]|nr:hypothetical protein [Anaerolineaceae bacterium]